MYNKNTYRGGKYLPYILKKVEKMKRQKNICLGIISFLAASNILIGQQFENYNPQVSNAEIVLTDHNEAVISFDFVLEAGNYSLTDRSKPIQLSACMLNAKLATQHMEQLNGGKHFVWTSNAQGDCLYGKQKGALTGDEKISIEVPVQVVEAASIGSGQVGVMINIQPAPIMNASNDRSDDALFYSRTQVQLQEEWNNLLQAQKGQVEEVSMSLSTYPNPSSDFVKIQLSRALSDAQVVLVDLSGRVVVRQQYARLLEATLDLSPVGSGRYEVLVQSDHLEQDLTQQVIVAK